jgi:4-alpha-glucanotransferase
LASFLQYALPGAPSIYYGDEAGMEGHKDPFNRRTYPWGKEDEALLAHYQALGQLKRNYQALRQGDIHFSENCCGRLGFTRRFGNEKLHIYINRSHEPWDLPKGTALLSQNLQGSTLMPMGFSIMED